MFRKGVSSLVDIEKLVGTESVMFDEKFLNDLDEFVATGSGEGRQVLWLVLKSHGENALRWRGKKTAEMLVGAIPESLEFMACVSPLWGPVFTRNIVECGVVERIVGFAREFGGYVATIFMHVSSTQNIEENVIVGVCCDLLSLNDVDIARITVQILRGANVSEKKQILMRIMLSTAESCLIGPVLKVFAERLDISGDEYVAVFDKLTQCIPTADVQLITDICTFMETCAGVPEAKAFIHERNVIAAVVSWAIGDVPFKLRAAATRALSEIIKASTVQQLEHFPDGQVSMIVDALVTFMDHDFNGIHEVLMALLHIVKYSSLPESVTEVLLSSFDAIAEFSHHPNELVRATAASLSAALAKENDIYEENDVYEGFYDDQLHPVTIMGDCSDMVSETTE